MNKVTIIIPTLNEADSLKVLLEEINKLSFKKLIEETIIIDANSTDDTQIVAKKYQCKLILEGDKKGFGAAIIEGNCNSKSFYSVVLDGDGSKNPNYILNLIKSIEENNDDFVFATRYGKEAGSEDDTWLTYFGNRIFSNLGKIMFGLKINDILHTFFICKTSKFKNLKFKYSNFSFCVELPILVNKFKYKYSEIPSHERRRIAGKVKVNSFIDGFIILKSMISLYFNIK